MSQNSVDLAVANVAVVGDQVTGRLSTNVDWTARRRCGHRGGGYRLRLYSAEEACHAPSSPDRHV